MTLTERTYTDC